MKSGVQQSFTQGPVLFTIHIRDISKPQNHRVVNATYADDTQKITVAKTKIKLRGEIEYFDKREHLKRETSRLVGRILQLYPLLSNPVFNPKTGMMLYKLHTDLRQPYMSHGTTKPHRIPQATKHRTVKEEARRSRMKTSCTEDTKMRPTSPKKGDGPKRSSARPRHRRKAIVFCI
ncbi:hypothetical protein Trydic_g3125 [Trypoxylus dichotomus]